MAPLNTPLDS